MNWEKYENKKEYPDYNLKKSNPDLYKQLLKEVKQEQIRLEQLFKDDCRTLFPPLSDKAWDKLYSYGWAEGHAYGYNEVYIVLSDMVELVEVLVNDWV